MDYCQLRDSCYFWYPKHEPNAFEHPAAVQGSQEIESEQEYISKNIAIENREKEFYLCLQEQDQAFPEYRYMCEAKAMSANPKFLFAFAHILKFVTGCFKILNAQLIKTFPQRVLIFFTIKLSGFG